MQIINSFKKKTRINKMSSQSMISDSFIYFTFNFLSTGVHEERNFTERESEIT